MKPADQSIAIRKKQLKLSEAARELNIVNGDISSQSIGK